MRVTFTMPAIEGCESLCLVGDFNEWNQALQAMHRNADGSWSLTVELEPEREYQFRYCGGEDLWYNDPAADAYVPNPYGSENSVVRTLSVRQSEGELTMKTLHFWPIAWTLAVFAAIGFTLDVLLGALFPNWWVMQKAWELILPDFTFISWGAFFLGLVESFVGGLLTATLFVPIYNYFASREAQKAAPTMKPVSEHH